MVNRGRSGGCLTCKQRRVKCDEAKPECGRCRRLGLRCEGYRKKPSGLKFKDQNHKFYNAVGGGEAERCDDLLVVPGPRPLTEPDTAVSFFLEHYVRMGRDMESTRGFFELLIPVYSSQRSDSALSLAVSTVASEVFSIWRYGAGGVQLPRKFYTQAVARLRNAVQDDTERRKPATLLAVLVLQLYENVVAVYALRSANRIHHNGAITLLPFAESNDNNGQVSASVRRFLRHTEVSSAMRQERPLENVTYSWIDSKALKPAPDNPSSALDAIGASVADFQASYKKMDSQVGFTSLSWQALWEWRAGAKRLDGRLLTWARSLPSHWQPLRLKSGQDIDASIIAYQSVCEVYPSCQIANIWNLWRIQRISLMKIALGSLITTLYVGRFQLSHDQLTSTTEDMDECEQRLQELVDCVCHSVPFYLGNRNTMSCMADFADPEILFPSYHPLSLKHEKLKEHNDDLMISEDEYRRQLIAQGPWHVMSPLSRLLTFFSEDDGQLIAALLRPGQYEWIREQFLRVITILRIPPAETGRNMGGCQPWPKSAQGIRDTKAEDLARGIRKGAMFMSGP